MFGHHTLVALLAVPLVYGDHGGVGSVATFGNHVTNNLIAAWHSSQGGCTMYYLNGTVDDMPWCAVPATNEDFTLGTIIDTANLPGRASSLARIHALAKKYSLARAVRGSSLSRVQEGNTCCHTHTSFLNGTSTYVLVRVANMSP